MTGSTLLTDGQRDWYEERFGARYVRVQENPVRPSRRVRRGKGRPSDAPVFQAQLKAQKMLRGANVRPV